MFDAYEGMTAGVVVVGGGASGLRAAIECLEKDQDTLLVTKGVVGQSHSLVAEGGINAAIGQRDPTDSWEIHFEDTLRAGRSINNRRMVELLCRESPDRIYDLVSFGAGFELDAEGRPIQVSGPSGGQSKERVVTSADFVGFVLIRCLLSKALSLGLRFLDETICTRVLVNDGGYVSGVVAYNMVHSKFVFVRSYRIILACGGAGHLFSRTTNPTETTGEGYVLGLEVGIELRDMEMIQFHPTAICTPPCVAGVLVTESARGIGAHLVNTNGERFMQRYDPGRMELAPRDIVARAITQEVLEGRGTPNGGVLLDLSHVDSDIILARLSNTSKLLKRFGDIDITQRAVEVSPAAHHVMGGLVATDVDTMRTDIPGIFLAGEIAWGCHGANRLGGNALAETQVFGFRAARGACGYVPATPKTTGTRLANDVTDHLDTLRRSLGPQPGGRFEFYPLKNQLLETMYVHVGLLRDGTSLEAAHAEVERLEDQFRNCRRSIDNYFSFGHLFELSKMLVLARIIILSAQARKESRGAHFRRDYPDESRECYNTSVAGQPPFAISKIPVPL